MKHTYLITQITSDLFTTSFRILTTELGEKFQFESEEEAVEALTNYVNEDISNKQYSQNRKDRVYEIKKVYAYE